MKRPWTRSEKWLWATPLLFGAFAFAITRGPNFARRVMGWPQQLDTTPTNTLHTVVLSRDGSVLAATGRDDRTTISPTSGTVYLWDAHTLLPLKPFAPQRWRNVHKLSEGWIVRGISLSPDGKLVGISDRGASGYAVYEVATQKLLWRTNASTQYAEFSSDGLFVALGQFELREAHTGKVVARWKVSNGSYVGHFSLSPDAKTVAWIGAQKPRPAQTDRETPQPPDGKAVEVRRASDGKILHVLPHSEETEAVTFSRDGSRVVSLAQGDLNSNAVDGSMIRCRSPNGKLLWQRDFRRSTNKASYRYFCDAIFSPDGKTISLRDMNTEATVFLLNASNGSDQKQLPPAKGQNTYYTNPQALAFSPDGTQLFARGQNAVLVWDAQ